MAEEAGITNIRPELQTTGEVQKDPMLKQWQDWIRAGKREIELLKPELQKADKLWEGKRYFAQNYRQQPVSPEDKTAETQIFNGLRIRIRRAIDHIYAKNPEPTATVKKPILVPIEGPDGQPVRDPQNPDNILYQDISEGRAEIVEAVLKDHLDMSGFKHHAKAATTEAFYHHGAWIVCGSDYDEDQQEEVVFQKWYEFPDVISDPKARMVEGKLENCRYFALKLRYTKEEAEKKGLSWEAMTVNETNREEDADEPGQEVRIIWQLWDKTRKLYGYVCEAGPWPMKPKAWPWRIDGIPAKPLVLNTTPGKKWDKPIILEAAPIQEEQNEFRETFRRHIVHNRPLTLYDPEAHDPKKIQVLADRAKEAWIPMEGLAAGRKTIEQVNDAPVIPQAFELYQDNGRTLDTIVGTTPADIGNFTKASATEVGDVAQKSESTMDAKRDILDDFLKDVIRCSKQIMEQVIKEKKIVQIMGKDGSKKWAPYDGDIISDCDIDIEVGSTTRMNQVAKIQLGINALNVASRVAPPVPGGLDTVQMFIDWLRDQGKKNPNKYRVPLPPPQPAPMAPPPGPPTPPNGPGNPNAGAGGGPTTAMNPGQSLADQANPMK